MIKDRPKLEDYISECWTYYWGGKEFERSGDIDYKTYVNDVIHWAIEAENHINELKFKVSNLEYEKELLQHGIGGQSLIDYTDDFLALLDHYGNDEFMQRKMIIDLYKDIKDGSYKVMKVAK